jgi:hypothetical protein
MVVVAVVLVVVCVGVGGDGAGGVCWWWWWWWWWGGPTHCQRPPFCTWASFHRQQLLLADQRGSSASGDAKCVLFSARKELSWWSNLTLSCRSQHNMRH